MKIEQFLQKKAFTRAKNPLTRIREVATVDVNNYTEALAPNNKRVPISQEEFALELDIRGHKIFNKAIYPDKLIQNEAGEYVRIEQIARVGIGFQKIIALRQAVHLVGNPPRLTTTKDVDAELFAKYKEYRKIKGINNAIYLTVKSALETGDGATIFFRDAKGKLRWKIWSYLNGETLIPTYEDDGVTLKAFARRYWSIQDGQTLDTVELINKVSVKKFINNNGDWEEISSKRHGFNQVPVAYQRNNDVAWGDGQELIDIIERALSDHREANSYFAFGILLLTGQIEVLPNKNNQGKVIIGEEDSNAKMIEQKEVSGGFKFEFDTYKEELYNLTGTVIIKPEQFKGGDVSGAAVRSYHDVAVQYAMDKAPLYFNFLNQIESITIEGMGLEKKMSDKVSNMEVNSELDIYVPQNTMEIATKLATLVAVGALSKKTAQEVNEFAKPDEVERVKAEEMIKYSESLVDDTNVLKIDNKLKQND